jgi:hypothetical protein
MSNAVRGYVRVPGTAAGVNGASVAVKTYNGNTTISTDATNAAGLFELPHDTLLYPGPVYATVTSGGDTDVMSGQVTGQFDGLMWAGDVNDVFKAFGVGVIAGVGGDLAVTASGTDMNVDIAAGIMLHMDGLPYMIEAARELTVTTASGSNPRIDTLVVTLTRESQSTDPGKMVMSIVAGTPAASPVAPTLTQTSATWQYPLANILVGTSVGVIASNKITDRRTYALSWPSTITPEAFLMTDINGKLTFATPSSGAIDASQIGGGLVSDTEFGYLNGVTSAIQTQLNAKAATFTQYMGVSMVIGDGTNVITSSEPAVDVEIPETCTLVRASIERISGSAGNLRVNLAKAAAASTSYSNIDGSDPLALVSASLLDKTSFTGWTLPVTQYDKIRLTVDAAVTPTLITRARISLAFTKSRS